MFTFFHRRKKTVVDCFTADSFAYEYAPIIRGSKAFPSWWTKLPMGDPENNIDYNLEQKNMRRCYGFLELYKRSIIIPSWTDIRFKVTPDKGYTWLKSTGPAPEEHAQSQYEGGFTGYYHTKLSSPWVFKEKSGVQFLFTPTTWNLENYDFLMPPGVLEFTTNHGTNVNLFLPKKKTDYSFFIPVGKPLVHIIPLQSDAKIEIRNHLISREELNKIAPAPSTMRGIFPLLDIKSKEKKCPFGFS
jgi:hypothetical protein